VTESSTSDFLQVPYVDLGGQHKVYVDELLVEIRDVIESGMFMLGDRVAEFERRFAELCGVKYAVGVGNGTDAIILAFKALGIGIGDEVITAPNSFLASASAIAMVGATPVFADVRTDMNIDPEAIERAITPKTRAILPVHLTGRTADMTAINAIADTHHLHVVEDAAQAVGASLNGRQAGSLGDIGCFSLHPLKNLTAIGDGGIMTTDNEEVLEYLVKARNHGLVNRDETEFWGPNSRLDALQAAILNVKLQYLDVETDSRLQNVAFYQEALNEVVDVPVDLPEQKAVYQTFMIQAERRDELHAYLLERGIDAKVHYPVPIHLQPAASYLGHVPGDFPVTERLSETIMSLPVHPQLSTKHLEHTADRIREFYGA
jgi:dTDP-4-amino-4,6-dideoxygalactose transaminase